ncbi:hypothetical protein [Deinococcus sp. QL22]|uniref:hypothetical protein n=1 Tax=Deinococcus sp. QL22 TaxID=2939437 RepID=UPI00201792E4|nr:hypothetical protein [Deinococcus sp. QL22]UQN06545.1 hypothetical protein M1R55_01085 [Deinococcus sp. QL22]
MDWTELDALLCQGAYISALSTYRAEVGGDLHEAIYALGQRGDYLRETQPERFPKRPAPALIARENLQGVSGRICVIEAVWDGDTVHDWFLVLVAVSEGASTSHARYTETWLCNITQRDVGQESLVELAIELQHQLAAERSAEIKVPVWPPDDEAPRWWNAAPLPLA